MEVPFGVGSGQEIPEVQAVAGLSPSGNLVVLFYANGLYPVSAQLEFAGEVLPDTHRFGSRLAVQVPLVTSVPGGPDVSLVSVQTTIGPAYLTYYRHEHGRRVAFRPRGVEVPARCPHGGFPFAASFAFQDGGQASATTTVPCPQAGPPLRRGLEWQETAAAAVGSSLALHALTARPGLAPGASRARTSRTCAGASPSY